MLTLSAYRIIMAPSGQVVALIITTAGAKAENGPCDGAILSYFSDTAGTNIGFFFVYLILLGYFFGGVCNVVVICSIKY